MELQLRMTGMHHAELKRHLLPDDGREAIAVALCGRHMNEGVIILTIHDITLIPYEECFSRESDILVWSTKRIMPYFEQIGKKDLALLKIHSHPGGYREFSRTDDISDRELFDSAFGWAINDKPHASAVMLPGGEIFGRLFFSDLRHKPIRKVIVAGDTLLHYTSIRKEAISDFALRTAQAFGEKTYQLLKNLKVGVVGCSGTGSPVIEQLVRLGIGKLVLVDPDVVESKNLNRILHTTASIADTGRAKVSVVADAINAMGLGTAVKTFQTNLYDSVDCLKEIVTCDFVFGCMDSVDGRYLLNQLCSFYIVPYLDIGVKLEADGYGGINKVCGTSHYIQPGKSSLLTRGQFSMEDVRAGGIYRTNPEEYESLKRSAYIQNVNVNNPAVISVNMQIASHAVNEFLNRVHPFKSEAPSNYAASTIDITEGYMVNVSENDFEADTYLRKRIGRGDMVPFLEMPELAI
jgi:hypothetical protein